MAQTEDDKDTEDTTQVTPSETDEAPEATAAGEARPDIEDAEIVEEAPEDGAPEDEESAADPEPAPTPAPAPAPKRRGGFLGPVIGGVIAAGIGYAGAQYIQPQGWPFPGSTGSGEETSTALSATQDRLATLEARVAELPTATNGGDPVDLSPQIAAVQDQIAALSEQVAAVDARLTELEKAPIAAAGEEAAAALTSYEREIEQMRAELAAQREENAKLAETVTSAANQAEAEIDAAMDRAAEVEARAALMRIDAALANGAPFESVLGQFGEVEVPAALAGVAGQGVATVAELQRDFPPAARAALTAALETQADGSAGDRLTAFLRTQLGARSLAPREGDDADAVLSRAEAALRESDLRAALAELEALPEAAQAEMAGWIAEATARADAVAAAQALEQSLNTN